MANCEKAEVLISPQYGISTGYEEHDFIIFPNAWLRLELVLAQHWDRNSKPFGYSPVPDSDVALLSVPASNETHLEIENDQNKMEAIRQSVEAQIRSGTSPLLDDLRQNMTQTQVMANEKYFRDKYEKGIRQGPESVGSRGYRENVLAKGQQNGYDLGQEVEGVASRYAWRETPFLIEAAFLLSRPINTKEIDVKLTQRSLQFELGGQTVLSGEFIGAIRESPLDSTWILSDSAMKPRLSETYVEDEDVPCFMNMLDSYTYKDVMQKPSIIMSLTKQERNQTIWGGLLKNE